MSGYVSEVLCGQIPVSAKEALVEHIRHNRNQTETLDWLRKRYPGYINAEEIKRFWYFENDVMSAVMAKAGYKWSDYKSVHHVCHRIGFGSGKEGIGLFEIAIREGDQLIMEFVPFDPLVAARHRMGKIEDISATRIESERLPAAEQGHILVSAGSWAKGTIHFSATIEKDFDEKALELLVVDMTNFGVGEDHFVAGLLYSGKELAGEILKETDREMYQVSWYAPERGKWLEMWEA